MAYLKNTTMLVEFHNRQHEAGVVHLQPGFAINHDRSLMAERIQIHTLGNNTVSAKAIKWFICNV